MTLYLKYRSKNLDEIDLQDVSGSLKKIVSSGKIPHAFLFSGPKGSGKTSAARILAKIVNCEHLGKGGVPCDKCDQCTSISKGTNLDVIEMDAASHRGIDDVRTLRDAVKLSPTKAKKKIYIIDEAHMLTTEASNALLKTLEEPPEHVVFILATTNPEKLIDTIRSRTTFIPFHRASVDETLRSLKRVAAGEKIKVDDDALKVIALASDGAFRDAIKILEQLVSEEKTLTKDFLEESLFRKKSFDTDRFIGFLVDRNTRLAMEEISKLAPSGVAVEVFLNALLSKLREGLLAEVGAGGTKIEKLGKDDLVRLIELFGEASRNLKDYTIEELPLEIAVIKWGETTEDRSQPARLNGNSAPEAPQTLPSGTRGQSRDPLEEIANGSPPTSGDGQKDSLPDVQNLEGGVNDDIWKNILAEIKPINASIEALLRAARPIAYDGKTLTLGVFYRFHKERLEDAHHRVVLEEVVGRTLHSPTRVVCTLVTPPVKKVVEEAKVETVLTEGEDTDIIKVAEEIFGN